MDVIDKATRGTIAAVESHIEPHRASAQDLAAWCEALTVTTPEDYTVAGEVLREIKTRYHQIDQERKGITGPLVEVERRTNALFRPILDTLSRAEKRVKEALAGYSDRSRAATVEALTLAATGPDPAPMGLSVLAQPEAKGVSVRQVERFEVTNPDRVPRDFCSPDLDKIKRHVEAGGMRAIPGVRFFTESVVSARRNK